MKHGCFDHPPRAARITVQTGWDLNGMRRTKRLKNTMSRDCRYDLRGTDPGCAGCKWNGAQPTSKEQK